MHWFGVVKLTETLDTKFEGKMCPRPDTTFNPTSMEYAGNVTWEEILTWPEPAMVMPQFRQWIINTLEPGTKPQFWTDNNGHDMKWLSIYMDEYSDGTIMGHSSRNISDRHKGLVEASQFCGKQLPKAIRRSFESLQITPHDHTPVNDATGKAEVLLALRQFGLQIQVH
jgi:hypothetical protein